MKFSDFAKIIYSIVGGEKYKFTIELLKAGLSSAGVEYIKTLRSDKSGKSRVRKFLSGDNDITEIASEIINYFDKLLFVDYIDEKFDESQYNEICEKFKEVSDNQLIIEEYDVPQRLAEIYHDILNEAAKGKSSKVENDVSSNTYDSEKSPDQINIVENHVIVEDHVNISLTQTYAIPESEDGVNNSLINIYTITELEKSIIKNIGNLICSDLRTIKQKTDEINRKQFELKNLNDLEEDPRWKRYLEYDLDILKEEFNVSYSELEKKCADIVKLLESKKQLNQSLNKIYDIASGISSNEYKITCPDAFKYTAFLLMVSDFQRNFDILLRDIDEL